MLTKQIGDHREILMSGYVTDEGARVPGKLDVLPISYIWDT